MSKIDTLETLGAHKSYTAPRDNKSRIYLRNRLPGCEQGMLLKNPNMVLEGSEVYVQDWPGQQECLCRQAAAGKLNGQLPVAREMIRSHTISLGIFLLLFVCLT